MFKRQTTKFILAFTITLILVAPLFASAQLVFTGTNICEYIKNIYDFGVRAAGILAVIAIMVGGVMYMSSGGSAEKVTGAKKIITEAIVGMLLVLGSWVLFNTIAPNLLVCKLTPIQGVATTTSPSGTNTSTTGVTGGGTPPSEAKSAGIAAANAAIPRQGDQKWQEVDYNPGGCNYTEDKTKWDLGRKPGTLSSAGCGVFASYMVIKGYGIETSPEEVGKQFVADGHRGCNNGTKHSAFTSGLSKWGLTGTEASLDSAKNALSSGKPVIFSNGGHIMVLSAYDKDKGTFLMHDSEKLSNRDNKWFTEAQMSSIYRNGWVITKK